MSNKFLYCIALTALIFSCTTSTYEKEEKPADFPIDQVKAKSHQMENGFKMEDISLTSEANMDTSFFKTYFEGMEVVNVKGKKLHVNSNWFFIDYKELGDYTVFSLLNDGHENLGSELFHVVYDKKSKTISSVNQLVSGETQDGYVNEDSLVWQNDNKMLIKYSKRFENEMPTGQSITVYKLEKGKLTELY